MTGTGEHLADLARAWAAEDKAVRQLIADELGEAWPAIEAAEDQAAAALREACTALGKPVQLLAGLDAEAERVTGKCAEWQGKLSSLRTEERVEARRELAAWSEELAQLREKRDQAERDLQPYYDARNKARGDLELVQGAKRGLAWAIVAPYESPVGRGTKAYISWRQPRLAYVLLAGDPGHPEWECAVAQLEEMCLRSAYRTDHLPSNAEEAARAMVAEMADASATLADAPSGVEVMAADALKIANGAIPPSRIEDHRNTPAPPRNPAPREWMSLPGRSAG